MNFLIKLIKVFRIKGVVKIMIDFRKVAIFGSIAASALILSACNLYKKPASNQTSSTVTGQEATGESAQVGATITYSTNGFSPSSVTIKAGQAVEFKNTSPATVQVNSAPHPTHELFPELNLGSIVAGQSKTATLTKTGTYKYHNHLNPSENGTIIVE